MFSMTLFNLRVALTWVSLQLCTIIKIDRFSGERHLARLETICAGANTGIWSCLALSILLAGGCNRERDIDAYINTVSQSIQRGNNWYISPSGHTYVTNSEGELSHSR